MKRIVLLESSGEVLFEGVSVLAKANPAPEDADACPPTQRSPQESGFFAKAPKSKGERAA